ncbi:MAG TPA: isopeptide-forming domain-containing fimbrial protein [Rhodanobacteraceae bacterium]|nr:isopeptide-forming domain-containing fimbrial protein [Rhodanobacteraceae bacterium]
MSSRRWRALLATLLLSLIATVALAEGTYELRGKSNANDTLYLEGTLGTVNADQQRVTFLRVDIFDPANEVIDIYGENLTNGTAPDIDIQVWCPGVFPVPTPDNAIVLPTPDFTGNFDTVGAINGWQDILDVQDVANHVPGAAPHHAPLTYALGGPSASCGQAGTYTVRYVTPGSDAQGQEFFDLSVRNTQSNSLSSGRVWADKYALSMGQSGSNAAAVFYVVAGDDLGSRYRGVLWQWDLNGMDPYGFQIYANSQGIGPSQYHYMSVGLGANPQPTIDPQFPLYLNSPSKPVDLPSLIVNVGTTSTQCNADTGGSQVAISFVTDGVYTYTVRVDANNDTIFDLNEQIASGTSANGTNVVNWNGQLPNGGGAIVAGQTYNIQVSVKAGEVHFPLFDVESAGDTGSTGGPLITPVNVSNTDPADKYFWDDRGPSVGASPTTSGPNGTTAVHTFAGNNDVIDTWKYATIARATAAYTYPASCAPAPEIALAKSASALVDNGDGSFTTNFVLHVLNTGNVTLNNVQLSDDISAALPSPVTFTLGTVSLSAGSGLVLNPSFNGVGDINLLTAASSSLAVGGSASITVPVTFTLNGGSGPYTNIANTQGTDSNNTTVTDTSTDGTDPDPDHNGTPTENTPTPVPMPSADLAITKDDGLSTVVPGQGVTYTLTVTNNGPDYVTGASVTDTLPATLTNASWTCSATAGASCTAAGGGSISDIVTIPSGGILTYTISATVDPSATGSLANTASVAVPAGYTDATPTNNSATDTDTLTPTADLAITKTDGVTTVVPGGTVTYTIVASNTGLSAVTGATVADSLPAGLLGATWTCLGAGGGACAGSGSGNINDTVDLPVGASVTYTVTGTLATTVAGNLVNTATVAAPAGVTDPTPGNNSATDTDTITPTPSLALVKSVTSTGPYVQGSLIAYQIVATNDGNVTLSNVSINDALLGTLSCTPTQPATLAPNATLTCTGSYTVQPGDVTTGNVHNQATASGTDPGNNPVSAPPASTDTPITAPSVIVTKSAAPGSGSAVTANQTITYTLTAVVADAPLTSNLVLTDTLSAGQTFGSVTVPGSYTAGGSGNTRTFTLPSGTVAGTYVVEYTATVNADASGNVGNSVVPSGGSPNPPTCTSCTTTHPLADPAISVSKASSPTTGTAVTANQTITYTLTAVVSDAALTSNLVLTDTLSAGQTFGAVTVPGSFTAGGSGNTRTFTLPSGTVPGTYTVEYTATVDADATGNVGNSVVVTSGGGDPDPGCTSCTTTHPLADSGVTVTKTADPASGTAVSVGQTITYTLTAVVVDSALSSDLVLADTLGSGLSFGSVTSAGPFTPNTTAAPVLTFTLPNGTVPGTYAVEYTATVATGAGSNPGHTVGNAVEITGNGGDPDPTCSNCTTTHDVAADLVVVKTVDNATPAAGDQVTFTLVVSNNGPSDATGVTVTDLLPSGYTWVSDVPSTGGYDHNTGVWTVGDLANGANATLTITVTVNGSGDYLNEATTSGNEPDPVSSNNSDSVSTAPSANADLEVVKTAPASVNVDDSITWTIVVTNHGPSAADGATFADTLPAGVTNLSAVCGAETGGAVCGTVSVSGLSVTSTITTLPAGATVTFVVIGDPPRTNTQLTNTATVQPPTGLPDPNLSNNSDSVDTTIVIPSGNAIAVPVDSRWMLLGMLLLLSLAGAWRLRSQR